MLELQTSTLPFSKEGIIHHSQLIFEEDKLPFHQGLGENVCNLLIYGNILELDNFLLDPVLDEAIFDFIMLGLVMEHWILKEFDTTLIIAVNHRRGQLLTK